MSAKNIGEKAVSGFRRIQRRAVRLYDGTDGLLSGRTQTSAHDSAAAV